MVLESLKWLFRIIVEMSRSFSTLSYGETAFLSSFQVQSTASYLMIPTDMLFPLFHDRHFRCKQTN